MPRLLANFSSIGLITRLNTLPPPLEVTRCQAAEESREFGAFQPRFFVLRFGDESDKIFFKFPFRQWLKNSDPKTQSG